LAIRTAKHVYWKSCLVCVVFAARLKVATADAHAVASEKCAPRRNDGVLSRSVARRPEHASRTRDTLHGLHSTVVACA